MITFGQLYGCVDALLNIIDNTTQIAVGHISRNHNFTFYILAVDRIWSHGRYHFCYIAQRNFAAVIRIYHQVPDFFYFIPGIILHFHDQIETLALLINLRDHFSSQSYVHIFRELRQGNTELSQHFPFRLYFQLRTLNLLLHVQVGNTGNITDSSFNLITE